MKINFFSAINDAGIDIVDTEIIFLSDDLIRKCFNKPNIVVVTIDHLIKDDLFLPINQRKSQPVEVFKKLAEENPDHNFLIINNCLNMPLPEKNLCFLSWAPEWLSNPKNDYRQIDPLSRKNLSGNNIWICLNNNQRVHRYLTSMYILGNNLEKSGYLTIDPWEISQEESWKTWLWWWEYNDHCITDIQDYFPVLKKGFYKLKNNVGYKKKEYLPSFTPNNNGKNFEKNLSLLYQDSLTEIINETVWQPDIGGIISEKYLNSVYGKNFPVIIGVANSIQSIRDLGFDVFDDIIDHSYDTISSPTVRLIQALERNKKLLCDFNYTKKCWESCQQKMVQNIHLAKEIENKSGNLLVESLKNTWLSR